jgi:hypothetical protein
VSTNDTTATPTPWPTKDQVITALGTMQDRDDLHPNWRSVLGRLRQGPERYTALRAARELLHGERQALAGETGTNPAHARPSGALAVFDAAAKVGELETMALCRYVCCGQAALELVAAGGAPASWSEPLPGERPRVDGDEQPLLPEPGEGLGDLRVPEALADAPGVDLLHTALRGSPRWRPPARSGRTCSAVAITAPSSRTAATAARTSRAHDRRCQRDGAGDGPRA